MYEDTIQLYERKKTFHLRNSTWCTVYGRNVFVDFMFFITVWTTVRTEPRFGEVLCYHNRNNTGVNMPKGIGYPKGMKKKSKKGKKKKK